MWHPCGDVKFTLIVVFCQQFTFYIPLADFHESVTQGNIISLIGVFNRSAGEIKIPFCSILMINTKTYQPVRKRYRCEIISYCRIPVTYSRYPVYGNNDFVVKLWWIISIIDCIVPTVIKNQKSRFFRRIFDNQICRCYYNRHWRGRPLAVCYWNRPIQIGWRFGVVNYEYVNKQHD